MPISPHTLQLAISSLIELRERKGFDIKTENVTGSYKRVLVQNEKFVIYTTAIAELQLYKKENYK